MAKRILEGYYSEESLQEMLHNEEIDYLTYVFHHSEERRQDFLNFCTERNLEKNEETAMLFMDYQLKQEEAIHTDYLD